MLTTTTTGSTVCTMISKDKKNKQRITLFLDPTIVKHARAEAVVEDTTLTRLVEKALLEYLPEQTVIRRIDS